MSEPSPTERKAASVDDLMVQRMEERRRQSQERRTEVKVVDVDRRRVCSFCFQRGDHRTAADCMRALERSAGR